VLAEFRSHLAGWTRRCSTASSATRPAPGDGRCAAFKAHGADCVIGFGGGAALDVAKVVG
jgi:glycerol dehydrogenase-like iron-containing ADH family enzyme